MPKRGKKSTDEVSAEQELSKAISMAVRSGKTGFGSKLAIENAITGKGKAFVVASNAPDQIKLSIQHYLKLNESKNVAKYIETQWHSMELGSMVGRPHSLAVLTIFEPGDSKILELA